MAREDVSAVSSNCVAAMCPVLRSWNVSTCLIQLIGRKRRRTLECDFLMLVMCACVVVLHPKRVVQLCMCLCKYSCINVCLHFVCSCVALTGSYRFHNLLYLQLPYLFDGDLKLSQSAAVSCVWILWVMTC